MRTTAVENSDNSSSYRQHEWDPTQVKYISEDPILMITMIKQLVESHFNNNLNLSITHITSIMMIISKYKEVCNMLSMNDNRTPQDLENLISGYYYSHLDVIKKEANIVSPQQGKRAKK
jgi:hypothetical protein